MDQDASLIIEFLEESIESLTEIDELISVLTTSNDLEKDVNSIFRPAHSIKGAASFFKLTGLMNMAHKLETLLDELRKFEREVSDDIIDVLSSGFFQLKGLVERGLHNDFSLTEDDEEFMKRLDIILQSKEEVSIEKSIENIVENISTGLITDVKELESELRKLVLVDNEESAENTGEPEEVKVLRDILNAQIAEASETHIKQLKEQLSALSKQCEENGLSGAVAHLEDFQTDFDVLVNSPVGIDELTGELLLEKLSLAGQEIAKKAPDNLKTEEKVEASQEKTDNAKENPDQQKPKAAPASKSIRVNVELLEEIMNLVGELVLSRNQLNLRSERIDDISLTKTSQLISGITSELQDRVMKTRLQPVSSIFNPLPGIVREISKKLGKKVELVVEGKETELDRSILEGIKDPMTHILRNSLDHGLETPEERDELGKRDPATLWVRAFHEGSQVIIEIKDNGRGVNIEKVKEKAIEKNLFTLQQLAAMSERQQAEIIFHPGFSTADQISQVSGRGVGMDVVKSNIQAIGGSVELDSVSGEGTTLQLKIPLTLAIIPALIVEAGQKRFALPQANLEEMVLLEGEDIKLVENIRGTEIYRLRGKILPLIRLNRILGEESSEEDDMLNIIVLSLGKKTFGLVVEKLHDMEEIVVKSLDDHLKKAKIFSGATIMGDGVVALILDVIKLAEEVGLSTEGDGEKQRVGTSISLDHSQGHQKGQVLLFSLNEDIQYGVPLADVHRLETLKSKRVETMGGKYFLQYRGKILPIVSTWDILGIPCETLPEEVVIIVFTESGEEMGLMAHWIDDVVSLNGEFDKDLAKEAYFLGSCVLQDKIITLFDLNRIAQIILLDHEVQKGESVLVWDESEEQRKNMANLLRDQGYDVKEVASRDEANDAIKYHEIDVVVTDTTLNAGEAKSFVESMKQMGGADTKMVAVGEGEIDDKIYQHQLNHDQLIDGLSELLQPPGN